VAPLLGALGALGPRFIEPPELPVPTPLGSSPIKLFLEICSNFLIFFYLSIKFSAGKFPEISGSTLLRLHTYALNFIKIQRFLAERWKYIKFPKWRPSAVLNFRNLPFWTRDVWFCFHPPNFALIGQTNLLPVGLECPYVPKSLWRCGLPPHGMGWCRHVISSINRFRPTETGVDLS